MTPIDPTSHESQVHPKEPRQGRQPSQRWTLPLLLVVLVAAFFAGASLALLVAPGAPGEDSPEAGFARDMRVHHAQAVQMAEIVRDKTESEEIRILATDIALTQQAQIGMMLGWLDVWALPASGTDPVMGWMGHPTERLMPGMATPEEINRLKEAPPEEAEEQFLGLMIRHHRAAIPMAEAILDRTERPEVRQLAQAIAASQRQEIRTMKAMSREQLVNFARLRLEPVDDSGVSGTATFEEVDGGVKVEVDVEGLPEARTAYLAHLHPGTCAEAAKAGGPERGEDHHPSQEEEGAAHEEEGHGGHMETGGRMAEIESPLTPLESDSGGSGSSTTVLDDATLDGLFSGEPEYLNVHAPRGREPSVLSLRGSLASTAVRSVVDLYCVYSAERLRGWSAQAVDEYILVRGNIIANRCKNS